MSHTGIAMDEYTHYETPTQERFLVGRRLPIFTKVTTSTSRSPPSKWLSLLEIACVSLQHSSTWIFVYLGPVSWPGRDVREVLTYRNDNGPPACKINFNCAGRISLDQHRAVKLHWLVFTSGMDGSTAAEPSSAAASLSTFWRSAGALVGPAVSRIFRVISWPEFTVRTYHFFVNFKTVKI